MIYWVAFALITILTYFLPGYALLSCARLEGIGRMGRFLLAVPVSLVLVPYALILVGSVFPLVPSLWMLAAGCLLMFAVALVHGRRTHNGTLTLVPRNQGASSPGALEWVGSLGLHPCVCRLGKPAECRPVGAWRPKPPCGDL